MLPVLFFSLFLIALANANVAPSFVITDPNGIDPEMFGGAVAISGNLLVVGASEKSDTYQNQGAAYVYECSSTVCTMVTQLEAFDAADFDNFGYSVAVDGSTVVVGAPSKTVGTNEFQGAAYVYDCSSSGCSLVSKLTADMGNAFDDFGTSVAVSGTMVVVGADQTTVNGNEGQGLAYIFQCSTGSCAQVGNVSCSTCSAGDLFGYSVAVSGNFVAVGAPFSSPNGVLLQGQAHVFDCSVPSSCSDLGFFTTLNGGEESYYGWSVAASGWKALIGSPYENGTMDGQGAVYPVDCTGNPCMQLDALYAGDAADEDNLGYSVSYSGNAALFGANNKNDGAGAAYYFDCTVFNECVEFREYGFSGIAAGDAMGSTVSIYGNFAVVGAPNHMVGGNPDRGMTLFYGAPTPACPQVTEGNALWSKTAVNSEAWGSCASGYTGHPSRWCYANSTFGPISNPCVLLSDCSAQTYAFVSWGQTTPGTMATGSCVLGANGIGTPSRLCESDGVWSTDVTNPCKQNFCPMETDGNADWPATFALNTASGTCLPGYTGSPTRPCNADGSWGSVTNPCQGNICPADVYGHASFSATPVGGTATGTCMDGYTGTISRKCLNNGWSTSVTPTCTRIYCPSTTFGGGTFASTPSNTTVWGQCSGVTGNIKGTCDINGNWIDQAGHC